MVSFVFQSMTLFLFLPWLGLPTQCGLGGERAAGEVLLAFQSSGGLTADSTEVLTNGGGSLQPWLPRFPRKSMELLSHCPCIRGEHQTGVLPRCVIGVKGQ